MHDALVKIFAARIFRQRLRHVPHEVDDDLNFLRNHLLFFANTLKFPSCTVVKKEDRQYSGGEADQEENHGGN